MKIKAIQLLIVAIVAAGLTACNDNPKEEHYHGDGHDHSGENLKHHKGDGHNHE